MYRYKYKDIDTLHGKVYIAITNKLSLIIRGVVWRVE